MLGQGDGAVAFAVVVVVDMIVVGGGMQRHCVGKV